MPLAAAPPAEISVDLQWPGRADLNCRTARPRRAPLAGRLARSREVGVLH